MNVLLLILVGTILIAPVGAMGTVQSTGDRLGRAQRAFDDNRWRDAAAEFQEVGAPAIPFMADVLQADRNSGSRLEVYLGIVHSVIGPGTEEAWIGLLSRAEPLLRSEAAVALGMRKARSAVPHLIVLLGDEACSGVLMNSSHGGPEGEATSTPILIRDRAIAALEEITGQVLENGSRQDRKAQAWREWWQANSAQYELEHGPN